MEYEPEERDCHELCCELMNCQAVGGNEQTRKKEITVRMWEGGRLRWDTHQCESGMQVHKDAGGESKQAGI